MTYILRGMGNIPLCVQFLLEMTVSLKRLNTFLDADEIKADFIEHIAPGEPIALELEFGSFYWNKLDEKIMQERRDRARKEKKAIRGKIRKMENHNFLNNDDLMLDRSEKSTTVMNSVYSDSIGSQSVSSVSHLKNQNLRGSLMLQGNTNMAFELRDLEMAIPRG